MPRRSFYLWSCTLAASLALAGCNAGSSSLPGGIAQSPERRHSTGSPIQHVVLIVQENRSFDNLFAKFPGANGATRGKAKEPKGKGYVDKWVTLQSHKLTLDTDLQHCHAAFVTDYDGGKMDGFYLEGKGACPHGVRAETIPYEYVEESAIKPYWVIAQQWVLADAMFQTQGSGSFTAHQDLIRGGTCIEACGSSSKSTESLVDNPTYWPWGCDAHPKVQTYTIDIAGQVKLNGPFPCSNDFPNYGSGGYDTLRDLLDSAGVSWKYYTPCFSASKQPGCSPSSDCGGTGTGTGGYEPCDADLLNAFDVIYPVRNGAEWGTNVSWPETNIFSDISSGALPAVSWVIPEDDESDHPGESTDNGPEWVASVVNAIGKSSYWNSTAIVVLWDDWGGFYDNAVPKQYTDVQGGLGFRVPMLVLSPYAIAGGGKGGYIADTQYEFGSIIKYIEQNWDLGSLHTTDVRATSIANVFDYSQTPRKFTKIPSALDAQYFINQPHPPQHGDPQ
jgi:phospholipase C